LPTKKEHIISTSQELFHDFGYSSVSTKRLAIAANVSEGLIFRHFENKTGLFRHIITQNMNTLVGDLQAIEKINNPNDRIHELIDIPLNSKEIRILHELTQDIRNLDPSFSDILFKETFIRYKQLIATTLRELNSHENEDEAMQLYLTLIGMMHEYHKLYPTQQTSIVRFLKNQYVINVK
jgi:AcrR family transcriptional regulator